MKGSKKIILFVLISITTISFVLANGNSEGNQQGGGNLVVEQQNNEINELNNVQIGQGTDNGSQTNTEQQTQNKGNENQLQNQLKIQSGTYKNTNEEQMQIQNENQFKLKVGEIKANFNMQFRLEYDSAQNRTTLKTRLSNGKDVEIKIMPNTASEKAIKRLQLKVCNQENNCSLEIREIEKRKQLNMIYEIKTQEKAKFLGLFRIQINSNVQVDAETGEILRSKKSWWKFLATK